MSAGLAVAAVGSQIAYPLTAGAARDAVTVAVVLLLASASVVHAAAVRGARWTVGLLAVTTVGGFLVELVGTRTGLPFGEYDYAPGRLGPELAGVPLLIGVAWTAGAYPAWCAAGRVARRTVTRVLLAAAGLAGWDLYLDPQMVADGRWVWERTDAGLPGVPDVPVGNYLGWVLVALVMATLLATLPRREPRGQDAWTGGAGESDTVPVALYLWTWLGSALAHLVFLGMPFSALYGALGMGVLGVALLRTLVPAGARRAGAPVRAPR